MRLEAGTQIPYIKYKLLWLKPHIWVTHYTLFFTVTYKDRTQYKELCKELELKGIVIMRKLLSV